MSLLTDHKATLRYGHLPLSERVLDELGDILYAIDIMLGVLDTEEAKDIRWIEGRLRNAYEEINSLMTRMTH